MSWYNFLYVRDTLNVIYLFICLYDNNGVIDIILKAPQVQTLRNIAFAKHQIS